MVCLALGLLAGCSTARNSLGTVDGGCFLALPTASDAVHHHGHLLGARLVGVGSLRRHSTIYAVATSSPGPKIRRVCLVAFGGSFNAANVDLPAGRGQGHVAVAVIEYPHSRLLGTVVLAHAPERFGHSHVGVG